MVSSSKALDQLAAEALKCTNCPLYQHATQTVFGRGHSGARLMLVGEQPGDEEDKQGEPFVGPAGKLLRKALDEAGIDVDQLYLTNVVKHFKWKPSSGWRRLHQKPNRSEIGACKPWLEEEVAIIQPQLIVGLGATACQALLGPNLKVTQSRGQVFDWEGLSVFVTVHPSSILRSRETREADYSALVADLVTARGFLT